MGEVKNIDGTVNSGSTKKPKQSVATVLGLLAGAAAYFAYQAVFAPVQIMEHRLPDVQIIESALPKQRNISQILDLPGENKQYYVEQVITELSRPRMIMLQGGFSQNEVPYSQIREYPSRINMANRQKERTIKEYPSRIR